MPVAVPASDTERRIDELKTASQTLSLHDDHLPINLRDFSSFDATPSIGTEFRAHSTDGKPILSIRDVLGDDIKLKALGRLV